MSWFPNSTMAKGVVEIAIANNQLRHNVRHADTGKVVYTSISKGAMLRAVEHYNSMSYGKNPFYYGGKCKCRSGSLTCIICREV